MVQGTPDWQLDRFYETDTARMLEKAYAEEPPMYEVTDKIGSADDFLGQAINALCKAADFADEYGKAEVLDDLIAKLEDIRCDIQSEKRKFEGRAS